MSPELVWTVSRLLEWTTSYLQQKKIESPLLETQVLLAFALHCKRIELYTRFDEEVDEEGRQRFRELIRQRVDGCPVAYLVGHKEFFSLEFEVTPAVLIPRDDSVCCVDDCLRLIKAIDKPKVLDIGTGSGCLAISIGWKKKEAEITAIDISPDALEVASRNAARHGISERITFLLGDLFEPLGKDQRFDLILSNPPYIPHDEIARLEPTVRNYEPHLALNGGPDGFAVMDRILSRADQYLKRGGFLVIEIDSTQEEQARQRFTPFPQFELAPTLRDGSNQPRCLRAQLR